MSLFGEKCERCGDKTRHKLEGKPICKICEEEMALLVEASGEARRKCPDDGTEMSKEVAHMIVIDKCPRCNGVWLDAGELEKVSTSASTEAIVAMSRGLGGPYA
jgi:hypothetical protein